MVAVMVKMNGKKEHKHRSTNKKRYYKGLECLVTNRLMQPW